VEAKATVVFLELETGRPARLATRSSAPDGSDRRLRFKNRGLTDPAP